MHWIVKQARKTLFGIIATGIKTICSREERLNSTPDTIGTAGDLEPIGRMRESADGKSLRRNLLGIKGWGDEEFDRIPRAGGGVGGNSY